MMRGAASLLTLVTLCSSVAAKIVVDGQWSPWSTIKTYCVDPEIRQNLVFCGGGVETRYRSCTKPAPQGGGQDCQPSIENGVEIRGEKNFPCNENPCPLPNEFMWSEWSECSARCGMGEQRRFKMCGSIRRRLPGMLSCHQKLGHTTTETPVTIPPEAGASTAAPPQTPPAATGQDTTMCNVSPYPASADDNKAIADGTQSKSWIKLWELELSEKCLLQPEMVNATYDEGGNLTNPDNATIRECNTWKYYPDYPDLWNHTNCPDPCLTYKCPKYAKCDTSLSTVEYPVIQCICQMGTVMKADNSACIVPPPTTPTPRPIPTMAPAIKSVTTGMSKSASTLIIIFLTISLLLFLVFRIFDPSRVIHMCEELSLLCAHLCMMPTLYDCQEEDPQDCKPVTSCKVISIAIHYFFTVCFVFMFLEAIYMYGLVASVVKNSGMLATKQNIFIGWGIPAFIILFNMCFEYDNYGGTYHCWLQMDKGLMYGQYVPIITLVVSTFTLIEAAGASDDYPSLKGTSKVDKTTAQICQRTLLIILPLVFASFVCGTIAEYQQDPVLYGSFTILNGVLGGAMMFFHITSNEKTRELVNKIKNKLCPGKEKDAE